MFTTPLVTRGHPAGLFRLEKPLVWQESLGRIVVPTGFTTDLASLPASLQGAFKKVGRSMRPAVLHDYLYRNQPVPRREADAIFLRALYAEGVRGARLYWLGVRLGGRQVWHNNMWGAML